MRRSPRFVRRVLISTISMSLILPVTTPRASQAVPLGRDVSYPLRHSFTMAPGLPGAGKHEVTSCYDAAEGQDYFCRIVAGVEEIGDKRNFYVDARSVLEKGTEPTFGLTLVDANGTQFEGCDVVDDWTYTCDYASRLHVSRTHYQAGHWVLRVFWSWRKYTQGQAACAAAVSGFWQGAARKAFLTMLDNCLNAPMERPS